VININISGTLQKYLIFLSLTIFTCGGSKNT